MNYISFDIGGTQVKYGIITDQAEILSKGSFDSQRDDAEKVFADLIQVVKANQAEYNLQGIALSMPGIIPYDTGIVPFMGAISITEPMNIKAYITSRTGLPVELENDANCATLAEYWQGAAKGCDNFICFTIGTGIGGGIVINGELYRGKNFSAGEFGMMYNEQDMKVLPEGFRGRKAGLPESWSSQGSMQTLLRRLSEMTNNDALEGVEVFERAAKQEEPYYSEVEHFYHANAVGIYNLWAALDPEKVVIGGGVSAQGDILVKNIERHLELIKENPIVFVPDNTVTTCQFGNDAGIIGALYHFLHQQKLI